jgi:hypothetical protein
MYTDRPAFYFNKGAVFLGDVSLTQLDATRIRIANSADASATSTDHAFTVGDDTTGLALKIDNNEVMASSSGSPSPLYLNNNGGDVAIGNDATYTLRFDASAGNLLKTRYKYENGYNELGVRDGTMASDQTYIIQNVADTCPMGGTSQAFVDVVFPTAFSDSPLWVVAMPKDVNSASYKAAVYSPTTTGCRVYMNQIHAATSTASIGFMVIVCGMKNSVIA